MARVALNALIDELVESIVTEDSQQRNTKALKSCKDLATKRLRHHKYGRTNQFSVKSSFDGLIEKFQVVNRDGLASELEERLEKLDAQSYRWKPETLSLLLNLSDDPVEKSSVLHLNLLEEPPEPTPHLTWEEIVADDPLEEDGLWDDVDFAEGSSDEERYLPSQDEDERTQDTSLSVHDGGRLQAELAHLIIKPDLKTLEAVEQIHHGPRTTGRVIISEIQAIKEALHMLRGLPSILFENDQRRQCFKTSKQYALENISNSTLDDLLSSIGGTGTTLTRIRTFISKEQTETVLQTFRNAVESALVDFMLQLSVIEKRFIHPAQGSIIVSILAVAAEIHKSSLLLSSLDNSISELQSASAGTTVLLNVLYDRLNETSASDDMVLFAGLQPVFFECLDTYMRDVSAWVEDGHLTPESIVFFVCQNPADEKLETFWQEQYMIRRERPIPHAPSFLLPFVSEIFASGKSVAFLRLMDYAPARSNTHSSTPIKDMRVSSEDTFFLPFSKVFQDSLQQWIRAKQKDCSSTLVQILMHQCGLLDCLDAIKTIYLSADASRFDEFATRLFKCLDSGSDEWHASYFVEDLARATLGSSPYVDKTAIVTNSQPSFKRGSKLKSLSAVSFEYQLPWSICNIIRPESMRVYQKVFCLLLQIRWANSRLHMIRVASMTPLKTSTSSSETTTALHLTLTMRQRMLCFVSTFEDYITSIAIASAWQALRDQLMASTSLDEMITVHSTFISSLESGCLLIKSASLLHTAILGLLDLTVQYVSCWRELQGHSAANESAKSRKDVDEEDSGSDVEVSDEDHVRPSERKTSSQPFATPTSQVARMKGIWRQYNDLLSLLTAGLQSASRNEQGSSSWSLLAEKLEWSNIKAE